MNKKMLSLISFSMLINLYACIPTHQWHRMEGTYYVTLLLDDSGNNAPFIRSISYLKLDINDDNTLTGQFSLGGESFSGTWRDMARIDYWSLNEPRTTLTITYDSGSQVNYNVIEYGKTIEFEFGRLGRILWQK